MTQQAAWVRLFFDKLTSVTQFASVFRLPLRRYLFALLKCHQLLQEKKITTRYCILARGAYMLVKNLAACASHGLTKKPNLGGTSGMLTEGSYN